jgi:hypothetical protein
LKVPFDHTGFEFPSDLHQVRRGLPCSDHKAKPPPWGGMVEAIGNMNPVGMGAGFDG